MGRKKTEKAIVPVAATPATMVKASCIYCYESLPLDTKKLQTTVPSKIKSFDDLCDGHKQEFLKPFSKNDKDIAITIVNSLSSYLHPMAKIFLSNVPFLVSEKKRRDKEWAELEKANKQYVKDMWSRINERIEKEEAARLELQKKGLLNETVEPLLEPKPLRKKREPVAVEKKSKKLSEVALDVQAQMIREGLSPSELMNRVSGGFNDAVGVQETVQNHTQEDEPSKKRRGRPPKRT